MYSFAPKCDTMNEMYPFLLLTETVCYISSIIVNFCYICMVCERCERAVSKEVSKYLNHSILNQKNSVFKGRGIPKALHTPSNYKDQNYQRFIRIFSLQLRKLPIELTMKELFTFNYGLLKSVSSMQYNLCFKFTNL